MRHANISVFVPHIGCPHTCSFCNQNAITGMNAVPSAKSVREAVERSGLIGSDRSKTAQIAFFGGSFTAIERTYMLSLLDEAKRCVEEYSLVGIRISTRPDCIDEEILGILKAYHVTAIELGAQSMDDEVLKANHRGHTADDVRKASGLIKEHGFELGLQMMTGLYTDTDEKALKTAEEIIRLAPKTVRIYPTIVLGGTYLGRLMTQGKYTPQGLDEAVCLCAKLIEMFEEKNIDIIRVGLHAEESLEAEMIAGPFHPAFKELCVSKMLFDRMLCGLKKLDNNGGKCYNISVNPQDVSAAVGQGKANALKFRDMGLTVEIKADKQIKRGDFEITPLI